MVLCSDIFSLARGLEQAGAALYNLDTLGDLQIIPRRVAAQVELRAVRGHRLYAVANARPYFST